MILIWSGRGYLGVAVLIPVVASCAGLPTVEPFWVFLCVLAVSFLLAGVVCVYFGTRWNWFATKHTLYFIPLQMWGWVYFSLFPLIGAATVLGAIKQGIDTPRGLYQAVGGAGCLILSGGVGYLLIRWTRRLRAYPPEMELPREEPKRPPNPWRRSGD